MNSTLKVLTIFDCHSMGQAFNEPLADPTIREIVVVCRLLLILQQMYNFSIQYDYLPANMELHGAEEDHILEKLRDGSIDLYIRAMSLTPELANFAQPVHQIYTWRLGFLLRRSGSVLFGPFFREPFEMPVWCSLYTTVIIMFGLFYILRLIEKRLMKTNREEECSLSYEILVALSAICQTSVPIIPTLTSRRIAYVTHFLFCFLMYTYYTSNLLYHLVNIKYPTMNIDDLIRSDYDCVILNTSSLRNLFNLKFEGKIIELKEHKFQTVTYLDALPAVTAIKGGHTAVLSDYLTLYPLVITIFDGETTCQLIEVDLLTDLRKYMWISKTCALKEKLKIGMIRLMEAGILSRIPRVREPAPPTCVTSSYVRAHLTHIMAPLTTLITICGFCVLIVIGERMYFYRHLPLPYIE